MIIGTWQGELIVFSVMTLWACAILSMMFFGVGFIFDFRIHDDRFQTVLLHFIPTDNVDFADIARVWRLKQFMQRTDGDPLDLFRTRTIVNRPFAPGLVIEKTHGFFRFAVFTPSDARAFIDSFKAAGIVVVE